MRGRLPTSRGLVSSKTTGSGQLHMCETGAARLEAHIGEEKSSGARVGEESAGGRGGEGRERREKCMGHRVQRVSHGYRVQCPEPRPQGHRPTEPIVPLLCSSVHFRCVLPLVSHQSFSLAFVRFATEPLRFEYVEINDLWTIVLMRYADLSVAIKNV